MQLRRAIKKEVCLQRVAERSYTAKCLGNKMADKILCWQVKKSAHEEEQ